MTLRKEIEGAMARGYCSDRNSHKEVDAYLIMDMSEEICQLFKERLLEIEDREHCGIHVRKIITELSGGSE
ncbi:MAG: hypothetical protein U9O94_01585 [Nanoarchaeota archaeon]|nr:hypothetical protein [Nanoarchaeota archaeon]